jgi:hypothetical protein
MNDEMNLVAKDVQELKKPTCMNLKHRNVCVSKSEKLAVFMKETWQFYGQ